MFIFRLFTIGTVLLIIAACTPREQSLELTEQNRQAARQFDKTFAEAVLNGNAEKMTSLYTEDAVIIPDGGKQVEGKESIAAFNEAFLQNDYEQFELNPIKISGSGDMLYMIGESTIRCADTANQSPNCLDGRYMCILNRQSNGDWKKSVAIWSAKPIN